MTIPHVLAATRGAAAPRPAAAAAGALLALALITGCSTAPGAQTASPAPSQSSSEQDYLLTIARCMRDKGFDVPDPEGGSDIRIPEGGDPGAAEKAFKECQEAADSLPGAQSASEAELQQFHLQMAQCLRMKGHDIADPVPGETLSISEEVPQEALDDCTERINAELSSARASEGAGR